jgi:predicted nucleic acid-binding protein
MFWDTSAVIKLYVDEPDAGLARTLAQTPESLLISVFTVHELHCGLHRKELAKALKPGMAEVLFEAFRNEIRAEFFRLITYNARVEQHALEIVRRCYGAEKPVFLRVLDALQLASALTVGATDIVSTDARMRQAASLLGMKVFPQTNG